MENRSSQHHRERLVEAMREELGTILSGELGDPRIGLVTITDLVLAPGGKAMRVYVAVHGTEDEALQSIKGLNAATGYIRHQLAEALALRHAPELSFHIDRSEEYSARIDELLTRLHKGRKKTQ